MNYHRIILGLGIISCLVIAYHYYPRLTQSRNTVNQILEASPSPQSEEPWATLEHLTAGYRLQYPHNWKPLLIEDKVELISTTSADKFIVEITDGIAQVTIDSAASSEEDKKKLNHTAELIRNTVEFIDPQILDKDEISKRFTK